MPPERSEGARTAGEPGDPDAPDGGTGALGRVAHALASAEGMESVLLRTAEGTLALGRADGVYVERIDRRRDDVVVAAASGWGTPPVGTRVPYPGSLAETVLEQDAPEFLRNLVEEVERPIARILAETCGACMGLVLPLVSEGEPLGALVLVRRPEREPFDPDESDNLRILADLGALALRRQLELEAAERRRSQLEESERSLTLDISEQKRARDAAHFMAEASRVLASSLDYVETLREVARLAVPRVADWCAIYIAESDGELEVVDVAHADAERAEFARELLRRYPPDSSAPAGVYQALRSGQPELLPEIDDEVLESFAQDAEHLELLREAGLTSLISVPMIARDRRVGAIGLATAGPSRRFTTDDLRLARGLADRTAIAVDNARLFYRAERRAQEEEALRRAIHAVTASYSVAEVIREIARGALEAANADGAYVEQIDLPAGELTVTAVAGPMTPAPGASLAFSGSLPEAAIRSHRPQVVERLGETEYPVPPGFAERCGGCAAVVLPLVDGGEAIGALTLVRSSDRPSFKDEDLARARTFADLAALAFRKLHLLEDSERRREELEDVMESRARLVRGLTHDLRNPLGAADGMASLLEQEILGELPDRAMEGIGRLRRALRRAIELLDHLIELDSAESGEIQIDRMAVDLRDVANEMLEEYGPQAEAKEQRVTFVPPADFPPIVSDGGRARQVLGNLLSNAVKYTPEGGRIEIRIALHPGEPGRAELSVTDDGPGIRAESQEEVFREFTRLDPSAAEGTGLGLAISRRVARALGGDLTLESEPGRGSTFTLSLPIE